MVNLTTEAHLRFQPSQLFLKTQYIRESSLNLILVDFNYKKFTGKKSLFVYVIDL